MEVCYNNHWGTVCHDGWGPQEAAVVCNEIEYPGNGMMCASVYIRGEPGVSLEVCSPPWKLSCPLGKVKTYNCTLFSTFPL